VRVAEVRRAKREVIARGGPGRLQVSIRKMEMEQQLGLHYLENQVGAEKGEDIICKHQGDANTKLSDLYTR
jgi:hypothetical protein